MGRLTKCTPEVQERIVEAIALGATYEHAAIFGLVSESAFYAWKARGQAEIDRLDADPKAAGLASEQRYVEFLEAIKAAEGAAVVANLAVIRKAANEGTWQAAAWGLERRYPAIYGRRVVDQRVSVEDLRRRAREAGLDPDQVVAEAEALSGLIPDSGS